MAYKGKIIRNTITGQEIKFLQTSVDTEGDLLEMQSTFSPTSNKPPAHYHPSQREDFVVEEGELTVCLNGVISVLKKGESLHVPANCIHSMWNASNKKTIVNWKVCPALSTEYFLETIFGLSNDGKTDQTGRPSIFQVALLSGKYANVFRLTKPSFKVQKVVFSLLAPVAHLKGYKADYEKYFS